MYSTHNTYFLTHQVDEDEQGGEEPAAAPGDVHVLPLLPPLRPHADAVLEEGGHQAEAGQVGQDVLGVASNLSRAEDSKIQIVFKIR